MDALLAMRTILLADTVAGGIVSLVGQNVFGGQLPEHYNPEVASTAEPGGNGPAFTLIVKGGSSHNEIPMQDVDVQLTAWGGINQNLNTRAIYNRAFQVLDGLCNLSLGAAGQLLRLVATVPAMDVVDPDTGWVMLVGVFHVVIMDNGQYPVNVVINPAQTAAQYTDAAIAAIAGIEDGIGQG